MRSAFLFSAINNPVTKAQDLSRMAVLRLKELDLGQARPDPIDAEIAGRVCLARVMLEWEKFEATLEVYKRALAAGGHVGRGGDTYGTLLAGAELLLGPELGEELGVALSADADFWTNNLAAADLPEVQDAMSNWSACLTWLLTAQVLVWRNGARMTVGALLGELEGKEIEAPEAKKQLGLTGLGLLLPGEVRPLDQGYVLAVPNSSPLVDKLFEGKDWVGGAWKDALRQAPPEIVFSDRRVNLIRIGGVRQRSSLVVLKNFHGSLER